MNSEQPQQQKSPTDYKASSSWELYSRLFSYVLMHKLVIFLALIGYLIFAASTPAATWWLGWTVDAISSEDYEQSRILSPLLCIGIAFVRGLGSFLGNYSMAGLANLVMHKLRCQLVDRLVGLPASYFDHNSGGRLVSRVTYDVNQIAGAASDAIAVLFREGFTVIGLLIYLFWIDWYLSLIFLLTAPLLAKIIALASKKFRRYSTQMQDSMGEVTQITNETIKGHRVVRTFNAEHFVNNKLIAASDRNRRQNLKMELTRNVSTPLVQLIVAMALALLVSLAMSPEFFADKSPGQFVAFLGAAGLLAKPIRQLTQINSVIQRGLSAAGSIFSILDTDPEIDRGTHKAERVEGRLQFDAVSFSYDGITPALTDVSFTAEPGQTIALVGKSGSGKSSLVNLIPRFYEYQRGSILLDGVELKDYRLSSLRRQVSIVTQQVVLFNGSVAENIAYGDSTLDRKRILAAAHSAHAMEFIEHLEKGLDTEVGDDAGLLSGGQRQRIAIARALLKDAPILILDEATSALDSESEQHIQDALQGLIKGRTTFVIAHRLSTIENADLILVLKAGKIVERGDHRTLLAKDGAYARLHRLQFSERPDRRDL